MGQLGQLGNRVPGPRRASLSRAARRDRPPTSRGRRRPGRGDRRHDRHLIAPSSSTSSANGAPPTADWALAVIFERTLLSCSSQTRSCIDVISRSVTSACSRSCACVSRVCDRRAPIAWVPATIAMAEARTIATGISDGTYSVHPVTRSRAPAAAVILNCWTAAWIPADVEDALGIAAADAARMADPRRRAAEDHRHPRQQADVVVGIVGAEGVSPTVVIRSRAGPAPTSTVSIRWGRLNLALARPTFANSRGGEPSARNDSFRAPPTLTFSARGLRSARRRGDRRAPWRPTRTARPGTRSGNQLSLVAQVGLHDRSARRL